MGNVANQYIGFLTTFRTTTTTANAVVGALGSPNGSSGNTLFNAYLTGASNVDCTFVFGNITTNQSMVASSVGLNDGRIHTLLAIAGPFASVSGTVVGHIYIDGRAVFKTSIGGVTLGISHTYDSVLAGGFRRGGTDGVYTTQGDVDNLAIFPILRWGMPSDAEALAISRRPAAFIFPRRIWAPVAAAGAGNTIAVPAGSLTLTGFAPTVTATANQVVEVPAGALTLAGQTPTVTSSDHQTISVPAGTLTLTANALTVTASENQSISVPAGALTLTGFEPSVLNGAQQVVQVPLGTLTLTGQAPTIAVSANQVIEVPAGTLTLAGQTPTVVATNPQLISVPLGTLTLTGLTPTVSNVGVNNQISVPLGTLTMSGGTPVVRVSSDADVFLDRFAARSRITQSAHFGSRITTQVGLRSSLKD